MTKSMPLRTKVDNKYQKRSKSAARLNLRWVLVV